TPAAEPDTLEMLSQLVPTLLQRGDSKDAETALAWLRRTAAQSPGSPRGWAALGGALAERYARGGSASDCRGARAALERAASLGPDARTAAEIAAGPRRTAGGAGP